MVVEILFALFPKRMELEKRLSQPVPPFAAARIPVTLLVKLMSLAVISWPDKVR